jgi:hypothetical protein
MYLSACLSVCLTTWSRVLFKNWFLVSQERPCILRLPEVHYHINNNPPPVPLQSQINPVHTLHPRSIWILSCHLHLDFPSGLFPSDFPTKTAYVLLLSPMCCIPYLTRTYRHVVPSCSHVCASLLTSELTVICMELAIKNILPPPPPPHLCTVQFPFLSITDMITVHPSMMKVITQDTVWNLCVPAFWFFKLFFKSKCSITATQTWTF